MAHLILAVIQMFCPYCNKATREAPEEIRALGVEWPVCRCHIDN